VDCGGVTQSSLATVDALARLRLDARRAGCPIELESAPPSLLELLDLAGLAALFLEGQGQAEEREEPGGVEEESELGDPPVL
jgi:STAS domain